ncbi:uncharacterized protein A1O9_01990 [Exophiala aquamarina CBS 119918]|uniref:Uncharacterized protein n=1 Tax=Exophiala aquamarina CBS 119918 TaxID=1182545 RepID=A0A072PJZ8_9EURO|nr:uncharacterized protein A1O9_01990 [Exophiala aquamarina CBS 119918]KEF60429.1 hypothetical protein A1O9_01990 [Exophiala aquamarina CBS 119918]
MVSYSDIKSNNESLAASGGGPVVAFIGGTAGIGHEALLALLRYTATPTVYFVGRGESRLNSQIASAQKLNPNAKLIPILANDLTLVKDAQNAADQIAAQAHHLDLLITSQGYLSFSSKPDFSPEGLDRITSIRYHARLRFVITLLPLLRKAPSPRVVSVLASGKEGPLDLEDLGMTKTGNYSIGAAAGAAVSMTTLTFEELSKQKENEKIVFIHIFPGPVSTGLKAVGGPLPLTFLWNILLKPFYWLIAYTPREAGERVLFAATNGRFRKLGPGVSGEGTLIQEGSNGHQGSGVYLVQGDSSVVPANAALKKLQGEGAGAKVLQYTLDEFERISKL